MTKSDRRQLACIFAAIATALALSPRLVAGTLSVSRTAPTVDGADIANLSGSSDAGGDQGHMWSNRPHQGQSFTTGANSGGYTLKAVTLKNLNNNVSSGPTFNLIVGTITSSGAAETLTQIGSTETGVAPNYSPGQYVTFTFATPLILSPNTDYGFLWGSNGNGFVTANNLNDGTYSGGTALSSGDNNSADLNNVILRNVDRVFHLDIDAAVPTGVADIDNTAATAITATSAQLNGEVTDIGDAAPSITIRWGDEDGGADSMGWDHAEVLPGTHGVGAFSASTASATLSPATTYYFRAFANNSAGDSSASPSLSFTSLPDPPTVDNLGATDILVSSATLGATVTDTGGEDPTVFIYWGPSDEGMNAGAWAHSVLLGAQNGSATAGISGLTGGTTYYHRAFVTNGGGSNWAGSTTSFTTATPVAPSVENRSANGISGSAANLRGEVTGTGFDPPAITLHYGDNDGGMTPASWDHSINLGVKTGDFSLFVSGLTPLTDYFYRAEATNGAGTTWAASTETFSTTDLVASSIVINEIHYDHEPKTERGEFVELFNPSDSPVDITGWSFGDGIDYIFPGGTTIPANGFIVVAEDLATVSSVFGVTALGPYTGSLSNDGERVELEDALGNTVDEVDYGIGFPWPTASRGGGSSMELMNASLDNDLGSSWRSSQAGFSGPQVTYVAAGETWSYRKGTSEASNPTSDWRQQGFVQDVSWLSGQTVIGYDDGDDTTVLNDMENNYASVFLRKEFTLSGAIPSQLLVRVYYDDGAIVWINGHEVARLNVDSGDITYEGIRASDPPGGQPGAAVTSHDAAWVDVPVSAAASFLVAGTNTVAVHGFNQALNSSDFSIDCELKTPAPTASSTGDPTPLAANTVFTPNAAPNIRQVDHTPQQPTAGQDVVVTAKVTDPDGVASVTLSYQLVEPGAYVHKEDAAYETGWVDLPMRDDGSGGDVVIGDSVYTVTLPGTLQVHRRLVRYRITVEDSPGVSVQTPFDDDESPNFAYFCYNGVPDWTGSKQPGSAPDITYPAAAMNSVATYHLITKESDVILCQWTGPTDGVYRYLGTVVYEGKVYDHMRYRIRGRASTRQVGRNKWKFNFNRARPLEARDNYGKKFKVPLDKINVLPGSNPWWRNNASTDGTLLCESAGFRAYQIAGSTACNTHFFHFRVIDSADEAPADQYAGDFWGIYIAIEQPEAEFLNERGLPDGNIYNAHGSPGNTSKRNQGATQSADFSDLSAFQGLHNSGTSQAQWEANLDFDDYFAFNAINLAINNSDIRPQENINYYHNSATDKWHTLPWDIDLTWEDGPHGGTTKENIYHCLQYAPIRQAYENRVRETLDLFLDNDQGAHLMDEYAGFVTQGGVDNLVEASQAVWDYHPRKSKKGIWYANFSSSLLPNRTFADYVQYSKDFIRASGYGGSDLASEQTDGAIPNKPILTHTGAAAFPTDDLSFSSSVFSDPQGAGTFGSMEWRVGQVHNPSTPGYVAGDRYVYELETFYQTPAMSPFNSSYTFPPISVRVGNRYRARVRHIDIDGRASNWSDAVEFTATVPDLTPWQDNLMITEIMYHPLDATPGETALGYSTSDFEYIELKNISDTLTLDLTELRFTKGVDFDFDTGSITSLAPGAYVLVVRNQAAFESRHVTGLPVAGEWEAGDKLDNGGENLKLSFGAGVAVHEFVYDDEGDWPTSPDGDGPSLVLIAPDSAPPLADPFSWRPSTSVGGTPGGTDAVGFAGDPVADDDGDSLNKFLEHALGTSDADADPDDAPVVGTGMFLDGMGVPREYLTITYQRNLAADDVVYEVQVSTQLVGGSWSTGGAGVEFVSTTDNSDGTATVTWRSATPISDLVREFIRLRVSSR